MFALKKIVARAPQHAIGHVGYGETAANDGRFRKAVVGVAVALLAPFAHAGGGFTVPAELTTAAANVVIVGAAVFAIAVGIKLWKWYQRSL